MAPSTAPTKSSSAGNSWRSRNLTDLEKRRIARARHIAITEAFCNSVQTVLTQSRKDKMIVSSDEIVANDCAVILNQIKMLYPSAEMTGRPDAPLLFTKHPSVLRLFRTRRRRAPVPSATVAAIASEAELISKVRSMEVSDINTQAEEMGAEQQDFIGATTHI